MLPCFEFLKGEIMSRRDNTKRRKSDTKQRSIPLGTVINGVVTNKPSESVIVAALKWKELEMNIERVLCFLGPGSSVQRW